MQSIYVKIKRIQVHKYKQIFSIFIKHDQLNILVILDAAGYLHFHYTKKARTFNVDSN